MKFRVLINGDPITQWLSVAEYYGLQSTPEEAYDQILNDWQTSLDVEVEED